MTLEESLKIDFMLENARMNRMGAKFVTKDYLKTDEKLNFEICKKCIHADAQGKCVTKIEMPFSGFMCLHNERFEPIK